LASRKSLYFGSPSDNGLAALATRSAGEQNHDAELCGAALVRDDGPVTADRVLLSTIYDSEGMPQRAGLELHLPDDEFAHRVAGAAIASTSVEVDRRRHRISFFRWVLDGRPGGAATNQ